MKNNKFRKLIRNLRLGKKYEKPSFRRNNDNVENGKEGQKGIVQPKQ